MHARPRVLRRSAGVRRWEFAVAEFGCVPPSCKIRQSATAVPARCAPRACGAPWRAAATRAATSRRGWTPPAAAAAAASGGALRLARRTCPRRRRAATAARPPRRRMTRVAGQADRATRRPAARRTRHTGRLEVERTARRRRFPACTTRLRRPARPGAARRRSSAGRTRLSRPPATTVSLRCVFARRGNCAPAPLRPRPRRAAGVRPGAPRR